MTIKVQERFASFALELSSVFSSWNAFRNWLHWHEYCSSRNEHGVFSGDNELNKIDDVFCHLWYILEIPQREGERNGYFFNRNFNRGRIRFCISCYLRSKTFFHLL